MLRISQASCVATLESRIAFHTRRNQTSAGTTRRAHVSGRALIEIVLIAVIPCFAWLLWTSLSGSSLLPAQAAAAVPHGPLKTVRCIVDLKEGRCLVVHRDGELRVWDERSQREVGEVANPLREARCGAYAPGKKLLMIGSVSGAMAVWDMANSPDVPAVVSGDTVSISACMFTSDESLLITGGGTGEVRLWDTATWKNVAILKSERDREAIHSLAISADGKTLFAGSFDGVVSRWNINDRTLEGSCQVSKSVQPDSIVVGIFPQADLSEVAIATREGMINVWDLKTGKMIRQCDAPLPLLIHCDATADGLSVFGVNETYQIARWNLKTCRRMVMPEFDLSQLRHVALSSDGRSVIGGDNSGNIAFASLDLNTFSVE